MKFWEESNAAAPPPQFFRHGNIERQRLGYVPLAALVTNRDTIAMGARGEDAGRIVSGGGGNLKKRFEFGMMNDRWPEIRASTWT